MKAVIQRVENASVSIDGKLYSAINSGMCIFLGIHINDKKLNVEKLVDKISKLRIFSDEFNYMNKSIVESRGEILVVSQFTLYGDCKKGNRPSFQNAANKLIAMPLYEMFINLLKAKNIIVKSGKFGADMNISLDNKGPVTIIMEQ